MRLIDADTLVSWLDIVPLENGLIDPDEIKQYISEMPVANGNWTSVKDGMPELEGDYWVTDGHHAPWKCRLLKLADVKGWVNGVSNPVINYWMPMPELPKEGGVK